MLRLFILRGAPIPASAITANAKDSVGRVGSNSFTRLWARPATLQIESYDQILEVEANGRPVKYNLEGEDFTVKTGKFAGELGIKYRGSISDKLLGLYKAAYDGGYVVSTQFEAVSARRLLPCLDHPAYKAEFKLSVRTDSDTSVISNMPSTSVKV